MIIQKQVGFPAPLNSATKSRIELSIFLVVFSMTMVQDPYQTQVYLLLIS